MRFFPIIVSTFISFALVVNTNIVDIEKVLSVRKARLTVEVDRTGTVKIEPSMVETCNDGVRVDDA